MATVSDPTRLLSLSYPHKTHCVAEAIKVNSTSGADKRESGDSKEPRWVVAEFVCDIARYIQILHTQKRTRNLMLNNLL
jgi:hypothetical protein